MNVGGQLAPLRRAGLDSRVAAKQWSVALNVLGCG